MMVVPPVPPLDKATLIASFILFLPVPPIFVKFIAPLSGSILAFPPKVSLSVSRDFERI